MWLESVDRDRLERSVGAARLRALALMPYSPAWDAAMVELEDLERLLWRLDEAGLSEDQDRDLGHDPGADQRRIAVPA